MKKQKWSMRKKIVTVIIIIFAIIIVVALAMLGTMYFAAKSMGIGSAEVADYDTRIEIWNSAAGNSSNSKLDDMNIGNSKNLMFATMKFADMIVSETYADGEQIIDTFTYLYEIERGFENETYEDAPYLIPYLVDDGDSAVIVIPGGGFGYKSMDGMNGEGKDVAISLNEAGINAFVLHYRTNPYEYPIPYLDLQRAVRYLRYHADTYHINPDKISMIGFSAGGNLIATFSNTVMGNNLFPDNYVPDDIDTVDDSVSSVAMIYPAVSFNFNVPMLFCMFDDELVRDANTRNELLSIMDMTENFNSSEIRQFIAYGTKDAMVGTGEVEKYIAKAESQNTDITVVKAEGQDHGFSQSYYINDFIEWFKACMN